MQLVALVPSTPGREPCNCRRRCARRPGCDAAPWDNSNPARPIDLGLYQFMFEVRSRADVKPPVGQRLFTIGTPGSGD
jgi:hypothetical protein